MSELRPIEKVEIENFDYATIFRDRRSRVRIWCNNPSENLIIEIRSIYSSENIIDRSQNITLKTVFSSEYKGNSYSNKWLDINFDNDEVEMIVSTPDLSKTEEKVSFLLEWHRCFD